MKSWGAYPKIYNLGHRAVARLLDEPVIIQEKIDGSQFSFGQDANSRLYLRSKGKEIIPEAPEKMFAPVVDYVQKIRHRLRCGWTYRCEFVNNHNVLKYKNLPSSKLVLFDINLGDQDYAHYSTLCSEATRLGLVPVMTWATQATNITLDYLNTQLDSESQLEGTNIEGIVIKPAKYDLFGRDGKVLMAKHVSEAFKEKHKRSPVWTKVSVIEALSQELRSEARWQKAVQHLREKGQLEDDPRDIGALIKEVQRDMMEEEQDYIKERLWKDAKNQLCRRCVVGLPEWYKNKLMKQQFDS